MDSTASPSARCPECGEVRTPGKFLPTRTRPRWPLWTTLALFTGWLVWCLASPERVTYISGSRLGLYVLPGFSPSQIRQLAAGEAPGDGSLTRGVLAASTDWDPITPGDDDVRLGFGPSAGVRPEYRSYGWPLWFASIDEKRNYEDALGERGFIPARTDPKARPLGRWEAPSDYLRIPTRPTWQHWGMTLQHTPAPESTGGAVVTRQINLVRLLSDVASIIAIWMLLCAIAWAITYHGSTKWKRIVAISHRVAISLVIGFALIRIVAWPRVSPPNMYERWSTFANTGPPGSTEMNRPEYRPIGLRMSHLRAMPGTADSDRELASLLVGAGVDGPEQHRLCVWRVQEAMIDGAAVGYGGFDGLWGTRQELATRRSDMGVREKFANPRGFLVRYENLRLSLHRNTGDPALGTTIYWLDVYGIASTAAIGWFIWKTLDLISRLTWRRRTRSRLCKGECVRCGYPLVTPASPASA